ncbi:MULTISPECIES: CopG family ribbon-helix-helix protein [Pseudomonas]|uniref:CopG family ribbon-helix-helix protein n=1 Tax=Pseudomonas TaxID=286 RepID=UPI000F0395D5|nr:MULTISPECIES: ribbon-helix-helix protein, CopG family [Pseudomonas]MBD8615577.1 ribbon-helix-helix protein, CopG family [Pseudomonas putida]MBD8681771.1 ribbon-helix-helix protein, CopG family [Pseudomonas sp. CFBP 13719]
MPATLSFRTLDESAEALDKLCQATERDRTYHLTRALTRYLETELWQAEAVKEGMADVEAGRTISLEDVKAKWVGKRNDRLNEQG